MGTKYFIGCLAAVVTLATPAQSADVQLLAKQRFAQTQQLRLDHLNRVDESRLTTIDIGLDRFADEIANGGAARSVLKGLSSIETSLLGLRLQPDVVRPRLERVECLRSAVTQSQGDVNCNAFEGPINLAVARRNLEAIRSVRTSRSVGSVLSDGSRAPFLVGIYGPNVDGELGGFFEALAKRDPNLLQPIPIDREYQFSACLSGSFPGLVHQDLTLADSTFLKLLGQASELVETSDDAWRFTLRQKNIPVLVERTGLTVPATLDEFKINDALRLITADFAARFGLSSIDAAQLSALRNLWVAQGDAGFRDVIEFVTDTKGLKNADAGTALTKAGIRSDQVWAQVFRGAVQNLHCRDANKVFEAYGLVYKSGDYPTARRVLKALQDELGFAAVPGVAISQTKRVFLESVRQNCALFGPVEQTAGGASSNECNLRQLTVDGRNRWEVLAGGADIQFFVTRDQRREILATMREFEDRPRGGDILRWRSTTRVPVKTQSSDVMIMPRDDTGIGSDLPCIISLSRIGSFDGTEALRGHVENYRQHFYPQGDAPDPEALSYVFVFDEFEGHLESEFQEQWGDAIKSLTQSYNNLASWINDPAGNTDGAGQNRLPDTTIFPVCTALADQINALRSGRDISHGAYVKSLLVGSKSPLADGIGLLNPDGAYDEEAFADRVEFWATEGDLNLVVENMIEARDMIPPGTDEGLGPTIFNLSLGSSYRFADEDETEDARKTIQDMKDIMGRWNDALFVVAAGQPDGDEERGMELQRVSALNVDVDDPACSFFPACLSTRANVITVGAVQPSASRLAHRRPVLIPWSNYGSAVTVAAPGARVLSKEFGFIEDEIEGIAALPATTVRDGTSVATVFVTALAARMAAEFPVLTAPEIKRRLIATAQPYNKAGEGNGKVLFEGKEGELYSGVIDPNAAMLDPSKWHVRWKRPAPGVPEIQVFQTLIGPDETTPFTVFKSERPRATPVFKCRWADIYRIHIETNIGENNAPLYKGGVACKNEVRGELIDVGFGPLGTERTQKQHACMIGGTCFKGLTADGELVEISFEDVRDIYFPVVGR